MTRALPLMVLLGLGACGDEAPPASEAPWLTLGAGPDVFRPLVEGGELELVFGPQGGWHVDLGVRFGGMAPDALVLTYRIRRDRTDDQVGYPVKLHLEAGDVTRLQDGGYERLGDRVIMSIAAADEVVGETLMVKAEVIQSGQVIIDDEAVTIVDQWP